MAKATTLLLATWAGYTEAERQARISGNKMFNILSGPNGAVLFHVGRGTNMAPGQAPNPTTLDDLLENQRVIIEAQARRTSSLSPTAENFLAQAKEFATTAKTLGYERVGISKAQYDELQGALARIEAGQASAITTLEQKVAKLPQEILSELDRMAAVREIGGGELAMAMAQRSPEELAQTISELKALRITKLSGWGYAWHICVSYVLPIMALVFAAGAGLVAGGIGGFITGRVTAPTPELEVGIDAAGADAAGVSSGVDNTVAMYN